MEIKRPYFIAEAGVNHEGDLIRAYDMIDAAAESGADAIKFQSYKAHNLALADSPSYWDLNQESCISQRKLFERFDSFNTDDYVRLANRCEDVGLDFMTTCFDDNFMRNLGPLQKQIKIASADITNRLLIDTALELEKPLLLSTGASTLAEIDRTVSYIQANCSHVLTLLHCVLRYPCEIEHAGLNFMQTLRETFVNCEVGYSDHCDQVTFFPQLAVAIMHGAAVVEKHFTLDKSLTGNDHYHSFDPVDLANYRRFVDMMILSNGDVSKDRAEERVAIENARRCLVWKRSLPSGHVVTRQDLDALRPFKGRMDPFDYDSVVGSTLTVDVQCGNAVGIDEFNRR
ncbi:N-acetylneuraminate synthase family protein [Litoricolaceae bacterium]|nr:N-acetylneuraminate synthase family protein [Litorivicinaceae bacterium]